MQKAQPLRWSYLLSGLVVLGFAIEVLGISLTDRNLHALLVPVPLVLKWVGYLGLAISFIAPFLSLAALAKVRSDLKRTTTLLEQRFLSVLVVLAVFLSVPEWLWSCGGHPTWYMGLAG